jgi:hypothetical protein
MTDPTQTPEYRENLAQIAEALMEETARHCPGYHPNNCPSEIVADLVNERDDTRKVLLMAASQHQGGHSGTGGAIADLFGIPYPLTMEGLEAKAIELKFDPKELWPWLAPMRAGKAS